MADELDQSFDEINTAKLHNEFQDRLEENISKTDEQIKTLETPLEKTDIDVNIPNEENLGNLMKNIQNMSQKDRNNLLANLMPMVNNKMNPSNKTFSSVGDNDRKFLLDKLKAKREQMTMMRKPKKMIEEHVHKQMEKIKNSAGGNNQQTQPSQQTQIDIAGNEVPVTNNTTNNNFQIPAGLSKAQKKRMKKKLKALNQQQTTQPSQSTTNVEEKEEDSGSDGE
jgi:hypothetical protein